MFLVIKILTLTQNNCYQCGEKNGGKYNMLVFIHSCTCLYNNVQLYIYLTIHKKQNKKDEIFGKRLHSGEGEMRLLSTHHRV